MSESKVKERNNDIDRVKVARILAAASILANVEDPIVAKLGEVIGETLATLTPKLITDVFSDRLYTEITVQQQELATELKALIAEAPASVESRIVLIN